tara:strand:+ start:122 stop:304 length:183 start_codon:yes stop_codon:yes gene_type:complete
MGLFRAISVYIIGSFFIHLTKEGSDKIKQIPIIGKDLEKMVKDKRENVIVILLALSQLIL